MWLAGRLALSLVLCRQQAVQRRGAQASAAQAVPLLLQKPCSESTEMSLKECKHDAPDDACLSHAIVWRVLRHKRYWPFLQWRNEVGRLEIYLAHTEAWAPVCREGFTSGSAAVACKAMGFAGSATCAERCRPRFLL